MGKRTWLNRQLAEDYFPAIAQLPDADVGYQQAATLAAQLRQSWYDRGSVAPGEKELSQLQALFDITRSQLKEQFGAEHFSLKYFGMTTAEYTKLNNQKQQNTAERNEDVKQIDNPDAIVTKAVWLLDESPHWFDIAAALAVLTGRRSSEVLATAQFQKASQWSVTFTGALKRGGERQLLSFEIPTLCNADRVITALATLRRQLPDVVDLAPEEINRKYGDRVATACEQHFHGLVPPRADGDLYTHLFRAVYACIATFWYCPSWVEPTEYKAAIQGHYAVLDETDPTLRRSLTASRHYADYEIADRVIAQQGGKRKGVKLGYAGIEPIQIFQRQRLEATTSEPPEATPNAQTPTANTQAMSPQSQTTSTPTNKQKRTPRKSLWMDYQDEDKAMQLLSHFGKTDTTEAKIAAMSDWINWSIDQLQAQTEAKAAADQSEADAPAIALAVDRQAIAPVIDEPKAEPTTLETQAATAIPAVDELRSIVGELATMFKTFMQVQMEATRGSATSRIAKPAAPRQSPKPAEQGTDLATATTTAKRRSNRSKSPEIEAEKAQIKQQVAQAIEDVKRYNQHIDKTGQPHRLKREVTVNFLKSITKSQGLLTDCLNEQQAELNEHYAQMRIEPGHNTTYREKITLDTIRQTLQTAAIEGKS